MNVKTADDDRFNIKRDQTVGKADSKSSSQKIIA